MNEVAAQLSGWGTPRVTTNGGTPCPEHTGKGSRLEDQAAQLAGWTTSQAHDASLGNPNRIGRHGTKHGDANLNGEAAMIAGWSTPRATDGEKGGPGMTFGAGGTPLPAQAAQLAGWATPSANEMRTHDLERLNARRAECKERMGNGNGFGLTLGNQITELVSGTPTPSSDPTQKASTGALGSLHSAFAAWLMMGDLWPEFMACAPAGPSRSSQKAKPPE